MTVREFAKCCTSEMYITFDNDAIGYQYIDIVVKHPYHAESVLKEEILDKEIYLINAYSENVIVVSLNCENER